MPGVPAPAGVHYTPPPPPPPRSAIPPPHEPPPAIQYQNAPPSEASATRFGGYAGPVAAASPFAAPPVAYGTPAWSNQPPKKKGTRRWAKVLGAVVAVVVLLGVGVRVLDHATRHHTSALPAAVDSYTSFSGDTAESSKERLQSNLPSELRGVVTNLQVGLYTQSASAVQVPSLMLITAEVPAGSQHDADAAFEDDNGNDEFHAVDAPHSGFGGKTKCLTESTSTPLAVCAWVDNGTMGMVLMPNADEATALALLAEIRPLVER